ncbi:S-adenosylmethionine-dependent methyltransferase [Vermiconidia calcicola]|uniref:S-adenosylmethionine-dependent methyltransferase n=1 Tax=Vermiconidia calcicola TaxID=1690605 RepID=A0ACC3N2Q2_9PEZI|nr:S-adenosylmethionine-dependent methyltransferase [Vermiconidia calcicola]
MLPTPSTSHVNYDHIYEPSEDSYLLLDTLASPTETAFLRSQSPADSPSPLVLEVGTGSGVVLAFATAHAGLIFGRSDILTLGIDVNPFACDATRQTALLAVKEAWGAQQASGVFLDGVCSDLTAVMKPRSVDVLIFNPPYVPTANLPSPPEKYDADASGSSFDRDLYLSSLATDGGVEGMEITHRLLAQLPSVLSRRGIAYILLCAGNKPEQVMGSIRNWPTPHDGGGVWLAEKVSSSGKKAGWEKLGVIRIWRSEAQG